MLNEYDRADELCKIMESIVGLGDIRNGSRRYPFPMLRAMIYTQMRRDGFSFPSIAAAFGKNHCTVIYMVKKWEAIAGERNTSWSDYLSVWDSFHRIVEEDGHTLESSTSERLTVLDLRMRMAGIPMDATVVLEPSKRRSFKYDKELNTLFIRG